MHWVNVDPDTRKHDLPQLMEHVRLPLLSQDYLVQNVEENVLMRSNAQCKYFNITFIKSNFVHIFIKIRLVFTLVAGKDLLIEALKYHLLRAEQKSIYQSSRTRPRIGPVGLPKVSSSY